jgi:putative ABC transport system permease protein
MNKLFYAKLAAVNIKKNGRIYTPYILTCIFTVAMFYILLFISLNKGISEMPGAIYISTLMMLGTIVIGIFSVIILLYTNSFLMKRRKKEIGLYNILGMGKNHIARVLSVEIMYVALISIIAGLFAGILLSKLMLALLLKMLLFRIPFGFEVSPAAVIITAALFAGIFLLTLLLNLGRIHISKPIELLYGGNVGEKEPKTKWLLAVIGFLTLGAGYTIALTIKNPLSALQLFFFAVILVIIGTYCLFTSGSIALLKALRSNKKYYYKPKHFTSVSGMLYRMKQNAVGLANICILSTMVLVMLSTTVSLYLGMNDALRNRFPRNIEITSDHITQEQSDAVAMKADALLKSSGIAVNNVSRYRYKVFACSESGSQLAMTSEYASGYSKDLVVYFIPLADYNALQGTSEVLSGGELLAYAPNADFHEENITFGSLKYHVKATLRSLNVEENFLLSTNKSFFFIIPDEQAIKDIYNSWTNGSGTWKEPAYYFGFDAAADGSSQIALASQLTNAVSNDDSKKGALINVASAEGNKDMFLYMYGGLFFLGIFLGALFIMATVIIMYYKQISEGYDDKKRFEIMQKVGLSRDEVKRTIRSQVLTVFFLPLIAAAIHILAAFKMITKLLYILDLTNVRLFAECTLGTFILFAAVYAIVYAMTAKAYYKIVS